MARNTHAQNWDSGGTKGRVLEEVALPTIEPQMRGVVQLDNSQQFARVLMNEDEVYVLASKSMTSQSLTFGQMATWEGTLSRR